MEYHNPVLLKESVDALVLNEAGIYVDATFGGGVHSKAILKKLAPEGKLFGFDQDVDAQVNKLDDERFSFVAANFRHLKRFMKLHRVTQLDGILADLGVSSHQIDAPERGFSYRFDAELDMRMNPQSEKTAKEVINDYPPDYIQQVLGQYGEVRNAKTVASKIIEERDNGPINTVAELVSLLEPLVRGNRSRYLSQVFQALRIEVNDEMGALHDLLQDGLELLKPGGCFVVIAYHSVEDRQVKNFFKTGNFEGVHQKDDFGNIYRPFKVITRKAVVPGDEEIKANPRSRSAKMRVAQKVE